MLAEFAMPALCSYTPRGCTELGRFCRAKQGIAAVENGHPLGHVMNLLQ